MSRLQNANQIEWFNLTQPHTVDIMNILHACAYVTCMCVCVCDDKQWRRKHKIYLHSIRVWNFVYAKPEPEMKWSAYKKLNPIWLSSHMHEWRWSEHQISIEMLKPLGDVKPNELNNLTLEMIIKWENHNKTHTYIHQLIAQLRLWSWPLATLTVGVKRTRKHTPRWLNKWKHGKSIPFDFVCIEMKLGSGCPFALTRTYYVFPRNFRELWWQNSNHAHRVTNIYFYVFFFKYVFLYVVNILKWRICLNRWRNEN